MNITFTRDIPGRKPRKRGETADYDDAIAQQLIDAGVAQTTADADKAAAKTATPKKGSKSK